MDLRRRERIAEEANSREPIMWRKETPGKERNREPKEGDREIKGELSRRRGIGKNEVWLFFYSH